MKKRRSIGKSRKNDAKHKKTVLDKPCFVNVGPGETEPPCLFLIWTVIGFTRKSRINLTPPWNRWFLPSPVVKREKTKSRRFFRSIILSHVNETMLFFHDFEYLIAIGVRHGRFDAQEFDPSDERSVEDDNH